MKTKLPGSVGGEENATRFQCFSSSCDPRWGQGAASDFDNDDDADYDYVGDDKHSIENVAEFEEENLRGKLLKLIENVSACKEEKK